MTVTFDSNVLVYATVPPSSVSKRDRARAIISRAVRAGTGVILLQALTEFSNVAHRKLRISPTVIQRRVDAWSSVAPVHAAALGDVAAALEVVRDHAFQFWDALLWATARRVGVRYL